MNHAGLEEGDLLLGPLTDGGKKHLFMVTLIRVGSIKATGKDFQGNLLEINLTTPKDMTNFGEWEYMRWNPISQSLESAEWPMPPVEGECG